MILATNNMGKLKEIREILKEYEISSLKDKDIDIDVIEDQDTFVGNAKKKALEIYDITHEEVLADDSGLCIETLNGFPGVMTHRFLGENATDEERNQYLIDEVIEIGKYLEVPEQVLFKSPSDGLSGKTDEDKLGVKYKDITSVINGEKVSNEVKSKVDKLHTNNLHKFNIPVYQREK